MLFLMLSYSSSIAWLPRIWDRILRALWVWPFCINHRGLSGRNRKPKNCITAGTAESPSMYLEINKQINKFLIFGYRSMLREDLHRRAQDQTSSLHILYCQKLSRHESYSSSTVENNTFAFSSSLSQDGLNVLLSMTQEPLLQRTFNQAK